MQTLFNISSFADCCADSLPFDEPFIAPCSRDCLCLRTERCLDQYKLVYSRLSFTVAKAKYCKTLAVFVPLNTHHRNWVAIFHCRATVILNQFGATEGDLQFRLDGSRRALSCLERLQDFVFRLTMRGKQITRRHWVPIFPAPKAPPCRRQEPVNKLEEEL